MAESTKTYSDKLQNQHSPVYPKGYQTRRARQPANIPFEKSFSQQFFYLPGSTPLILRPQFVQPEIAERDSHISAALVDLKQNQTAYLIPAWNEMKYPHSLEENEQWEKFFLRDINKWAVEKHSSVSIKKVWALSNDISWAERWFLISGIDAEQAMQLANLRNQDFFYEWSNEALNLRSLNPAKLSEQNYFFSLELAPVQDCLLQISPTGDPCNPYGGPYGGKAIAARILWEHHHDLLKQVQPQSHCALRSKPHGGISLRPIWLGSRYGGYAWG